jgi:hypothetical protein
MIRNLLRWLLLIGLAICGLLYLNSTFYSAWVAGGPPNDYPHAWAQRALIHFGFSISLMASGVMAFIAFKADFKWKVSKYKYLWILILLLGLGYPKAREWVLVDKCLDSGGAWSSQHFECKK